MTTLRQKMTSEHLQIRFTKKYEEFFLRNDLVLSTPFSMWWGSVIHGFTWDYPIAKSKTYLRGFVGMKEIKEQTSKITAVTQFDIHRDTFEEVNMHEINSQTQELEKIIDRCLANFGITWRVSIEILTEIPRGHCFGFSGLVWGLIAEGVFRLFDVLNWSENMQSKYELARELELISKHQNSIGENSIHSLQNYDWLAFCEKIKDQYDLTEIKDSDLEKIPLDFWIIFSGTKTDTTFLEKNRKNNESVFKELELSAKKEGFAVKNLSAAYQEVYTALSCNNIQILKDLVASDSNDAYGAKFISNINSLAALISTIYESQGLTEAMQFTFSKKRTNMREELGFIPMYSSNSSGSYAFFLERWIGQNTFLEAFEEVKTLYPWIRIEYASFLDKWREDRNLRIEQFRSDGVLHPVYSQKIHYIEFFNAEKLYCDNVSEVQNALLFDEHTWKIFFKWRALDSKHIPSQKATTELIINLIKTRNFKIKNSDLPHSSYRNSKSEMASKIISPLVRFLKAEEEELILNCKGNVSSFDFEFVSASLPIGVVYTL